MLMDIFSNFDEQNFTFLSLSCMVWLMGLLPLFLYNFPYWISESRWNSLLLLPMFFMSSQVMRSYGRNLNGFINIVVSFFVMLIMINMTGLFPYVFSVSSHLSFALCMAIPFWGSLILSGVKSNFKEVIAHLLPLGSPVALNPFLVLVETVSISVRPITLSVRLVANMSAGHIILGLIGSYLSSGIFIYPLLVSLLLMMIQTFYFLFEIAVGLIQAYIFSLLVTLYSDDHPSN
uniref:ATP synthase subunit a n=1 Tax=Callochiton steinenii TaxID=2719128 RepID=A0A6H1PGH8_9MOLL|nr:ATP synthase F0 subunit 6 [Callochiton steinenii]